MSKTAAEQASYEINALELGPMENFIYLISDKKTGRAAIVDPAWEVDKILRLAKQKGVTITDILLTHSHHDHINGVQQVLNHSDAQLHLLKPEADFWGQTIMSLPCTTVVTPSPSATPRSKSSTPPATRRVQPVTRSTTTLSPAIPCSCSAVVVAISPAVIRKSCTTPCVNSDSFPVIRLFIRVIIMP